MSIYDLLRRELGEFTIESLEMLCGDDSRLMQITQPLAEFYFNWLERAEEERRVTSLDTIYHCVGIVDEPGLSQPSPASEKAFENRLKQQLLFFPKITVEDPLGRTLWPVTMAANILQSAGSQFGFSTEDLDFFRLKMRQALMRLLKLEAAVQARRVMLVPSSYAIDYQSVQEAAQADKAFWKSNTSLRGVEFYRQRLAKIVSDHELDNDSLSMFEEGVNINGQLCSRLNFAPIAGDRVSKEILREQFRLNSALIGTTARENAVSEAIVSFAVPGIEGVPLELVVDLASNEESFSKWRREFGRALESSAANASDQEGFVREFRETAESTLAPLAESIASKMNSTGAVKDLIIPGAVAIGAGAVATVVSGEVSVGSITGLAGVMSTWVGKRLWERRSVRKSGEVLIKEVCGHFLPKD